MPSEGNEFSKSVVRRPTALIPIRTWPDHTYHLSSPRSNARCGFNLWWYSSRGNPWWKKSSTPSYARQRTRRHHLVGRPGTVLNFSIWIADYTPSTIPLSQRWAPQAFFLSWMGRYSKTCLRFLVCGCFAGLWWSCLASRTSALASLRFSGFSLTIIKDFSQLPCPERTKVS